MNLGSKGNYNRILAISGGSVSFKERKKVPIVGILWREIVFEKCFIKYSETDPKPQEITEKLLALVDEKYFTEKQVKVVLLFNTIFAGLGIVDLHRLQNTWNAPIIVVSDKEPDTDKVLQLIQDLKYSNEYITTLQKNPSNWIHLEDTRLYTLTMSLSEGEMKNIIKELQTVGHLPEPLRIADIIAKAIH